jgi:hypothetical protein
MIDRSPPYPYNKINLIFKHSKCSDKEEYTVF